MRKWVITKWCKSFTDSGKDEYTKEKHNGMKKRFRLLNSEKKICAYGIAYDDVEEEPLNHYSYYGFTELQYKDPISGKYETVYILL